jgi:hypothetical protein
MCCDRFYGGFDILFDPEVGVSKFLRKVGILSPDNTSPHYREQQFFSAYY